MIALILCIINILLSFSGNSFTEKDVSDFLEEALRMRGLRHRNILTMIGLVVRENRPYVVLPFMKNGDLRSFLKNTDQVREIFNNDFNPPF